MGISTTDFLDRILLQIGRYHDNDLWIWEKCLDTIKIDHLYNNKGLSFRYHAANVR